MAQLSKYERCRQSGHTIHEDALIWYCYVCDMRTDRAFAYHSRQMLERIKYGYLQVQTGHKTATA